MIVLARGIGKVLENEDTTVNGDVLEVVIAVTDPEILDMVMSLQVPLEGNLAVPGPETTGKGAVGVPVMSVLFLG